MGPVPKTSVLLRKRNLDTGTQREDDYVKIEAETGIYYHKPRDTRGFWQPPEAR